MERCERAWWEGGAGREGEWIARCNAGMGSASRYLTVSQIGSTQLTHDEEVILCLLVTVKDCDGLL